MVYILCNGTHAYNIDIGDMTFLADSETVEAGNSSGPAQEVKH
jgi:hypothetical protein